MKQFLRHIFLLLALFVATASAWAQLPYNTTMTQSHFNSSSTKIASSGDNGWDNGVRLGGTKTGAFSEPAWNWDDKYIIIALSSNGIPNRLTCTTSTNSNSTSETKFYVATSTNNSSYTEIWSSGDRNNTIDIALSKDVKYIKICYSGNFAGYFKNIKVTELKYFNSPSTADIAFEQKILNSTPSVSDFTIDWCNVPAISYSIEGADKDRFSVTSIDNNSSIGRYGTATIHLSYTHDEYATADQPHTATLKLWSNGTTYDVTLTGVTDRYIADFNWNIANVNANSGEYHVGDYATITDAYTLKNKTTGNVISLPVNFTIKTHSRSSIYQEDGDGNYDNDVLSIEGEELKAKNAGVATITASFAGNSEYKPFTKELTLTIKKHEPEFKWNADNATYYFGTSIPNIFATSNPDCQYTIVSDNEHVAKVIDNTLHIYNIEETANITVTQEENYKWYGKTKTYTITPANPNNHVTFTINSENYYNVFRYDNTGNLSWTNNGVLLGSPDVGSGVSNYDDRYYDIVFTGIPDKLSFTYERSTSIATDCDWYVKESVDGVTWSEKNVWEKENSKSGSVEVPLNPTTRYLRFCYSGNYGGYFRNVKVTELEKFEADPNPLDFGTRPVGEGEQLLLLNFSHANAGRITTATIIGKDAQYFTVTPTVIPGTGRDMLGTTHLNVTFANDGEDRGSNPYEATLVITDNAGRREEVPLTGVRHGKATPEFTWNPNNFPYYFNTSIANIVVSSNTDYANCPLTITSNNENIAKVENGRLYIYDQSGEVTFTVTQRENDRYNEHTESFTFTPKAKPELEVPFQVTQPIYGQAITVGDNCSWDGEERQVKLGNGDWNDFTKKTAMLVFSGRPDKLTFTYAVSNGSAVLESTDWSAPKWEVEESQDGETWNSIWSVSTNSTSWANEEIQLSETTQYVRFSYDGNYAGYFKNINISELVGYKYLRAADGHYLSRGAKWGTQAVVDAFGVVSRLSRYTLDNENIYTRFFFLDNEQYMFETETEDEQRLHEVFTDNGTAANTNHLWKIDDNGGVLTIQSANEVGEVSHKGSYITAINGVLAFTTNEAEATKWLMEDYTEHPQYIADMLNRQAAEAAFKDFGKDINTLEKVRNRLTVEDFEAHEIIIPILELGEQKGEGRTVEGMPHIYEQTIIGLDPGFYRLTIKAFYRISNSEIAWKCNQEKGKESVLAYAYANNVQSPIQSVYASYQSSAIENTDELRDGKYYSTTLSSAAIAFNDVNRYLNDVYVYVEADPGQTTGTLHYGIKSPSYVPGAWLAYGTVTLTHFGRKEYIFKGSDPEKPTDWHTAENWNRGAVPNQYHDVRISENTSISTPVSVYSLTIDKSKCVHVASEGGINVGNGGVTADATDVQNIIIDNDLDGAGFLCINPTATHRSPKVQVNYTTRAKSGDANEQVWQYVGAPGENPVMSSTENAKIYYWSETEGWVKHSANFEPFKGYAISQKNNANDTYAITVTPIIASHTVELTKTSDGMNGDNLFVNSYLAPIDLTTFTDFDDALNDPNDDFKGDFEKTFYLFNSGSLKDCYDNGGKGSEQLANGSSPGQYYAITPLGAALLDQDLEQTTIPPMQGVYVVANENGAKIHLDYNKHVYKAQTNNLNRPMRVQQEENENFIRVRLQVNSPNSGADRMYVIQHENTTRNYDNGYDARNILAESQVNIYTNEADGQMEISVADQIDSTFIGFTAGEDSVYTLTFTSLVGKDMYLHDFVADSLFLLVEDGQYSFSAQPNSVNDLRFQLILYPELSDDNLEDNVTTGMEDVLSSARIWVNDKQIYITNAPQNSTLDIYTVSGMCITSSLTIHDAPCTIDLSHLSTGVYVLRLNNQAYKFVCK